ncbi:E1-E2 ATPase family protein [Mycobacterium kansasii 732]|nr:E1-E2 ATPase family protein [Mycobacterium kansasii 732]
MRDSVLRTVGALVPMVPEGLVLMTSIAFAVGVIRLGQRRCLVQELPAIEGLARVDVVCADKTGTLTESGMRVSEVKGLGALLTIVSWTCWLPWLLPMTDPTPACRRSPRPVIPGPLGSQLRQRLSNLRPSGAAPRIVTTATG